jgi:hypothetical protein
VRHHRSTPDLPLQMATARRIAGNGLPLPIPKDRSPGGDKLPEAPLGMPYSGSSVAGDGVSRLSMSEYSRQLLGCTYEIKEQREA